MALRDKNKKYRIDGERLYLRIIMQSDKSEKYLSWLNDDEVQRFTRRRGKKFVMRDVEEFLASAVSSDDFHFGIFLNAADRHIGNISLNLIDEKNMSAEISIMIGDRSVWGSGYAKDAIRLLTSFAFEELRLHRLWAESPNEAFNRLMRTLGWTKEGMRREAFQVDGTYTDLTCWSLLTNEYATE